MDQLRPRVIIQLRRKPKIPPVGIEPTIFRLEGGRLSHWATGALLLPVKDKIKVVFYLIAVR